MKIKRTTGIVNPETGKKDFEIEREDGVCVLARRDGSKFVVFDMIPASLSQCKEIVADWDFDVDSEEVTSPCTDSPCRGRGAWDCVDPCALLIRLCGMQLSHDNELRRTLDAYGWMKPDGTPDFEEADKNFKKWSK
jgi:hypothetical protein